MIKEGIKLSWQRNIFYNVAIALGTITLGCFVANWFEKGVNTQAWTPRQINQYNEKQRIINQINTEHENEVNFEYSRIFNEGGAKILQDSLEIYQKYGFPIKLLEPTHEQKEKAVKQSWLEKSVN